MVSSTCTSYWWGSSYIRPRWCPWTVPSSISAIGANPLRTQWFVYQCTHLGLRLGPPSHLAVSEWTAPCMVGCVWWSIQHRSFGTCQSAFAVYGIGLSVSARFGFWRWAPSRVRSWARSRFLGIRILKIALSVSLIDGRLALRLKTLYLIRII